MMVSTSGMICAPSVSITPIDTAGMGTSNSLGESGTSLPNPTKRYTFQILCDTDIETGINEPGFDYVLGCRYHEQIFLRTATHSRYLDQSREKRKYHDSSPESRILMKASSGMMDSIGV
ncbi:hypothetical protein E2P81_ATG10773 [Venturia nashicola]|uniref:Uncharacterized protein n=1 Tax=Venturia nashicola TaxID=86259 RepID=A0A4Z1P153_9PEZI|nr:hypothetical protein E6O75_ATG10444 [Venturia nashicola]TLD27485.1 hypothetical protein E2P81_ATG10773 [Venturia nashicola]